MTVGSYCEMTAGFDQDHGTRGVSRSRPKRNSSCSLNPAGSSPMLADQASWCSRGQVCWSATSAPALPIPGGLGHPQRSGLRLVPDLVCVALAAERAGGARGCPEMERPAGHLIRARSGLAT
jgi:hypothetical protein